MTKNMNNLGGWAGCPTFLHFLSLVATKQECGWGDLLLVHVNDGHSGFLHVMLRIGILGKIASQSSLMNFRYAGFWLIIWFQPQPRVRCSYCEHYRQGVWRLLFTRLPVKTLPNIQISIAGTWDLIIIISTSYNINNWKLPIWSTGYR